MQMVKPEEIRNILKTFSVNIGVSNTQISKKIILYTELDLLVAQVKSIFLR